MGSSPSSRDMPPGFRLNSLSLFGVLPAEGVGDRGTFWKPAKTILQESTCSSYRDQLNMVITLYSTEPKIYKYFDLNAFYLCPRITI